MSTNMIVLCKKANFDRSFVRKKNYEQTNECTNLFPFISNERTNSCWLKKKWLFSTNTILFMRSFVRSFDKKMQTNKRTLESFFSFRTNKRTKWLFVDTLIPVIIQINSDILIDLSIRYLFLISFQNIETIKRRRKIVLFKFFSSLF